jgi:hypothetical protein
MSTGLNCEIVERKANEWYYILEDWDAPKLAWDWREHASATGPFPTQEAALTHLHHNQANPGGHLVYSLPPDTLDPVLESLFQDATR